MQSGRAIDLSIREHLGAYRQTYCHFTPRSCSAFGQRRPDLTVPNSRLDSDCTSFLALTPAPDTSMRDAPFAPRALQNGAPRPKVLRLSACSRSSSSLNFRTLERLHARKLTRTSQLPPAPRGIRRRCCRICFLCTSVLGSRSLQVQDVWVHSGMAHYDSMTLHSGSLGSDADHDTRRASPLDRPGLVDSRPRRFPPIHRP